VTKEQAAKEPDWRCEPCAEYATAFSVRSALLVSSQPSWIARLTHFRAFWLEQERMKAAKGKAKAAAATLAAVGGAAMSPASTPRVPAKPAERAQTAYQRKLALVTNALKAQGSTFSLQLSFGSAAADLVCVNASLDDTSVDDCAAVLTSLLIDVTIGDKSERLALEQALDDAAEDYEAAAAEAAAKQRADQLRKELEAVEAQAEAARLRRRSFLEEQEEPPAPPPAKPPAGKQPALAPPPPQVQQKDGEEEAAAPKQRAAPAPTYQLGEDEEEEEEDDDDGTTAFRMEPVPQQLQQQ